MLPRTKKQPLGVLRAPLHRALTCVAEPTVETETGEEDEMTLVSSKAKLFEMGAETKEWVEKGTGAIKINRCTVGRPYSRICNTRCMLHLSLL